MCRAMHFDNWSRDQQQACSDVWRNLALMGFGTSGALLSCAATLFTGVTAIACGASSGTAAVSAVDATVSARACNAEYPGHPSYCD